MYAIGTDPAPSLASSDADNIAWCLANRCALVTLDRGKKDPEIKDLLARYTNLSCILVSKGLVMPDLLYHWVRHHRHFEEEVERCFERGGCYRRRLAREGGIKNF